MNMTKCEECGYTGMHGRFCGAWVKENLAKDSKIAEQEQTIAALRELLRKAETINRDAWETAYLTALRDKLEILAEPGTPNGILKGVWDYAEKECGHNPSSARHAFTTIRNTIKALREESDALKAKLCIVVAEIDGERHEAKALRERNAELEAVASLKVQELSGEVDSDAWKAIIKYAYADGGDGAQNIYNVTSEFVAMRAQRDRALSELATRNMDVKNLLVILDAQIEISECDIEDEDRVIVEQIRRDALEGK